MQSKRITAAVVATLAAMTSGGQLARAAETTWKGGTATAPHWSQAGNWDAGEPTTANALDAIFPSFIPATPGATISLGTGEVANSLTLNGSYVLGTAAGAGDLTLTTGGVSVASGVTATIASRLNGSAGLAVSGGGTLNLTNTSTPLNNFTGGTSVSGGSTLSFSADGALGATTGNNITLNGGTLASTPSSGTVNLAATRIITIGAGGGTITTAGAGTSGKLVIAGSQLVGAAGTTFTKMGGGALQITNNSTFAGTFNVSGLVESSFSGALGTGAVNINSGGELALSNSASEFANTVTFNTGGVVSAIGGNGANITGPMTAAGNFSVALRDFNTTANGRNLTFSGSLSGAGNLTTVAATGGNGTLFLSNANNNTTYTGNISVAAGTGISFTTATSKGTGTLTVASSTTALGGVGVGYVPASQSAFPVIDTNNTGTNGGVFEINTAGFNTVVDLETLYTPSGSKWYLGSASTGVYTPDTLGVAADGNYRLGGGGGTLSFTPTTANVALLTGTNNLIIGSPSINGGGTVNLNTSGNDFTGTVTINNGTVGITSINNGTNETTSSLGGGSSAILLGSTAAGGISYSGPTDSTVRNVTIGSGGGTITVTNDASTLTLVNVTGTGPITKSGPGQLTFASPTASSYTALTVNGDSVASGSAATALTAAEGTALTLGAAANTVTGGMSIGTSGQSAKLVIPAGGSLTAGSASTDLNIAQRSATQANASVGILDASAATNLSLNFNNIRLAVDTSTSGSAGFMNGVIRLPTSAASVNTITAANSVTLGDSPQEGSILASISLGGGTTTMTTPSLMVGGRKTSGTITIGAGGVFTLKGAGANRTVLTIGQQSVDTGTQPVSSMNLSGGTFNGTLGFTTIGAKSGGGAAGRETGTLNLGSSAASNTTILTTTGNAVRAGYLVYTAGTQSTSAQANGTLIIGGGTLTITSNDTVAGFAAVVLGNYLTTTAVTAGTNSANGTLTINGGNVTINSGGTNDAIQMGVRSGTFTGSNTANGTVTIAGGSLTVNNAIAGNNVAGAQTSTLTLSGGLLNMQGKNISGISNLTFSGGTLRNLGTLSQPLTQTGATSLLEVAANNATISGNYSLTGGASDVGAGRTLSIAGNMTLGATGAKVGVNVDGTAKSAGLYAISGTFNPDVAGDTLSITAVTPVTTEQKYTIATFTGGYANTGGINAFNTVLVNGLATQNTNAGAANYALVTYNANNIELTVNNLAAIPEPAAVGLLGFGAVGLLGRRRRVSTLLGRV